MIGFFLLALVVTLAGAATSTHYHIVPPNSTALCQHYSVGTCFTLRNLSSQINETTTGTITISFLPGDHLLTWNVTLSGVKVTLNRELRHNLFNSTPRITCHGNVGFDFSYLHTLTLEGLEIHSCKRHSLGIIQVHHVDSVLIKQCQFSNNQVTVGLDLKYYPFLCGEEVIYLEYSRIQIKNCTFLNNSVHSKVCPASGVVSFVLSNASIDSCYFELNRGNAAGGALGAVINSRVIINNTHFYSNSATFGSCAVIWYRTQMNISRSWFINNTAEVTGGAIIAEEMDKTFPSSFISSRNVYSGNDAGRKGGAVSSNGMVATFSEDMFSNNSAAHGAALYIQGELITVIHNSSFTDIIKDTFSVVYIQQASINFRGQVLFSNNSGPLYIFNSEVNFYGNTTFSNNKGDSGGAITSIDSLITFKTSSITIIEGNTAIYGGGLSLDQSTVNVYGSMVISNNKAEISGGGIHAFQSEIEFRPEHKATFLVAVYNYLLQQTEITNNIASSGGGIYLTASTIRVSNSHILIHGNSAQQNGGGVFLEQDSGINLRKWIPDQLYDSGSAQVHLLIRLDIINNSAIRGGGVFVFDSANTGVLCKEANTFSYLSSKQCFFQTLALYDEGILKIIVARVYRNIFFMNNTAEETGSDVYGGLLDRCAASPLAEIFRAHYHDINVNKNVHGLQYLNATASFDWDDGHTPTTSDFYGHVSSDAVRVCFCNNDVMDCSLKHPTVFKKQGEPFIVSVVVVDMVGRPVNATLISSLTSSNGGIGRLKEGQEFRQVTSQCTELVYNVYSNDSMAELQLYADGPCSNQGISKQQVNVSFLPCNCPIGLQRCPPLIDCFCDCDERIKSYVSNCSSTNSTVQINTNTWIEYINTTNASGFVTPHCPFDYCVEKPVNISLGSSNERDKQCAFNRTGRMCGQCEEGLSLVFASSRCQDCSNYYIFLLLPFALAGISLVAFILLLKMTVATGTIHGLIFYANMLAANRSIFLPFSTPNFLTVFISWLNLDLGIETCFYDGMDSYGKFLLQLTFPAYVFLIIVAIIILCSRSQRLAVLIGKRNPEATLYTLLLLSYSKLIRIIITALQFTTINYPDGTQKIAWLYDANVLYFNVSHIPRFLAASIIIIVGTIYTTLLLFGQLFDRCSEHKLMKWTTHQYYIHFIRAHHAPLSKKHRYWVGLLMLARLTHYLISAFTPDSTVILSVGTVAFVLMLHKNLCKQMYNSWSLDWLETSFLANLVVLALSTFYVKNESEYQKVLALISMSICFVSFVGIVFYHLLDKCGVKLSKIPERVRDALRHQYRPYQPLLNREEDQEELFDEDEYLLDLHVEMDEVHNYTNDNTNESNDPAVYHTPPIIRHAVPDDQLREPALDDLIPIQPEDYDMPRAPQPRHRQAVTYAEIDIRAIPDENN